MAGRSGRPGGRSPRRRRPGRPGTGGRTGRGYPSRGCGCSGTGARARGSAAGARSCSAAGWPGRGSGWCCRRGTSRLGSLTACLDRALRIIGGAPAYLLTDNAKTVTVEHVAGIPVRHPDMVALGRHYGCTVADVPAVRPRVQGRHRGHREDRQGGPGAGRGEPARGVRQLRASWRRTATPGASG